ncbi:MAG: hypothetical protein E6Q97_30745 [Desulfurellales bacterium]|nr:MAG: hypothetical protein E6Q97_30745 [Desulfurellales bacterium]
MQMAVKRGWDLAIDRCVDATPERRLAHLLTAATLQKRVSRFVMHSDRRIEMRVEYAFAGFTWSFDFVRRSGAGAVWHKAGGRPIRPGMLSNDLESLCLDVLDRVDAECRRSR